MPVDPGQSGRHVTFLGAVATGVIAVGVVAVGATLAVATADVGGGSASFPATAVDAVGAVLAVHLTLSASICARATGTAVAGRTAGCASLLVVALLASVQATPGSTVVRTVALLLAAGWALLAVTGPEIAPRRRVIEHGLLSAGVVVLVVLAVTVRPPAPGALLTQAQMVATATAWTAAAIAWLPALRRRGDAVVTWAFLVPGSVAVGELATLVGGGTAWSLSLAAAIRAGGLFAAGIGVAAGLATHVAGRRAELLRAQAEAREAERATRLRAQERDHEVANAMFAIEGAATTMARHAGKLTETTERELAESVSVGLVRLRALFGDTGGTEPARTDVHLADVVGERVALAHGRGVAVEVTGDLEVVARADAGIIGQVVDNLLLNAIRHGRAGTDRPVTIQLGVEAGRAVVRVRDRGPGIPPDAREAVFERGVRLDVDGPGHGLGLFVSRRLLHTIGGDLHVDEHLRDGACLVASLPLGLRRSPEVLRG